MVNNFPIDSRVEVVLFFKDNLEGVGWIRPTLTRGNPDRFGSCAATVKAGLPGLLIFLRAKKVYLTPRRGVFDWLIMTTAETRAEYFPRIAAREANLPPTRPHSPDIWRYIEEESRLKNTPFNLHLEWKSFTANFKDGLAEGLTAPEAALKAYRGTELNIRSFMREFGEQALVLPHLIGEKDGQIVNSFDGKPILPRITKNERGGSVFFASQQLQTFFQMHKETGAMAFYTNPDGWIGVFDKNGKPILDKEGKPFVYKSSETFVFWRGENGNLRGVTIVTDMDRDKHKSLLASFGVKDNMDGESEEEEIMNIVSHPAFIAGGMDKLNTPVDVAKKIVEIRGTKDIRIEQMDGSIEYKPVSDIFKDLDRLDELLLFNETGERYLEDLKEMVLTNADHLEDPRIQLWVIRGIEDVILRLTRQIRKRGAGQEIIFNQAITLRQKSVEQPNFESEDFSEEVKFLANRVGCAPGSSRSSIRGYGAGRISGDGIESTFLPGKCINCGKAGLVECGWCRGCVMKTSLSG